jgi:hypothetical protein
VPLPEEVYRVLVEVVEAMREGKVITLVPHTQRVTTPDMPRHTVVLDACVLVPIGRGTGAYGEHFQ